MYKFKDPSGLVFKGATYPAVVRALRRTAWTVMPKRNYMQEVAIRLSIMGTKGIKVTNSQDFIRSLVKQGWLKSIK